MPALIQETAEHALDRIGLLQASHPNVSSCEFKIVASEIRKRERPFWANARRTDQFSTVRIAPANRRSLMHTTSGEISPKTDTVWRCVSFDQPYDRPTSSSAVRNTAPRTKISALGVEEQRVNVIVHLLSPGAAPLLGQGFRVDARVVVSEVRDALRLPTDALVRNGTGWAVSRLEQGRARFTPVSIGDGGGDFHALRSGLTAGQRVILFPGSS